MFGHESIKAKDHYFGCWFLHTNCPNWSIAGAVVHVYLALQRDLTTSTLVSFSDNMFTNTWHVCVLAPPVVVQFLSKLDSTHRFYGLFLHEISCSDSNSCGGHNISSSSRVSSPQRLGDPSFKFLWIGWIWLSKTTSKNFNKKSQDVASIPYPSISLSFEVPHLPRYWSHSSFETHCVIEIPFAVSDPVGVGIVTKRQRAI